MKSLLLTATALALVTVASGAASAAGTQTNGRVATELNGAIANGIKSAPGDAVKNRNIVVEANGANAGAATGGKITNSPRFLIAAPATGTASGGVAPNTNVATNVTNSGGNGNNGGNGQSNGAKVVTPSNVAPINVAANTGAPNGQNGRNQAQFFIATPARGTASGGAAPVKTGGTNIVTTSTGQGGKGQQQQQFVIAPPSQGAPSGGAAPNNGNGNFGNNNGGNGQPVQVAVNQAPGNFAGQGQFGGQQSAGNFSQGSTFNQGNVVQGGNFAQGNDAGRSGGAQFASQPANTFSPPGNFNQQSNVSPPAQAQFIPAVNTSATVAGAETFQPTQAQSSFNAGGQGGLTPVADGADLYRRMVAQGYWAVSVLDSNSAIFQVLAVDAQHPGYAFLLAVDINWGRILTVRAIALPHGGANTNYGHSVPTYQASAPAQTYGNTSGQGYARSYGNTYSGGYQSAPSYGNAGYGQVAYGSRY